MDSNNFKMEDTKKLIQTVEKLKKIIFFLNI